MDYAYRYCDEHKLYLNITNRCTNRCFFCVRNYREGLGGAVLWGGEEPDIGALQSAVLKKGELNSFNEFIWCGYGEPTFRMKLMSEASSWLRSRGAQIRLNTNGHACLIHDRDVMPELSEIVDEISISLNAPDSARYVELCRPGSEFSDIPPERFWDALIEFMRRAPLYFEHVQASVVGDSLSLAEIEECRFLANSLGIRHFRIR